MSLTQETVRKAQVVETESKGVSFDCNGHIDSNPGRENLSIEPLNCTTSEFLDWFLQVDTECVFCSDGETLTDIGGSTLDLSVGSILSVSYSEWFSVWLTDQVEHAKSQVSRMTEESMKRIESHNPIILGAQGNI